jgi:hypothetical protein
MEEGPFEAAISCGFQTTASYCRGPESIANMNLSRWRLCARVQKTGGEEKLVLHSSGISPRIISRQLLAQITG